MSSSSTRTPLKRKATRQSYTDDQQPSDIDMSDGEQQKTRAKRQVNKRSVPSQAKGKGKAKKSTVAEISSDESDKEDQIDSDSDAERPIKKKAKRTAKSRKTSKGKGKQRGVDRLTSLPIELLTEICTFLTPGDLLALSRTNKAFRKHLLDPESRSLWKAARERLELPDLSVEMTEQQYAHLMFVKECQECGSTKVQRADLHIRKILCKSCREKNWFTWSWGTETEFPHLHADTRTTALVTPYSAKEPRYDSSAHLYSYLPDVEALSTRLWKLYPEHGEGAKREMLKDAVARAEETEEDRLLREIMEDNEANLVSTSTRTRQTRRPSYFGGQSSSAAPETPVEDDDGEAQSDEEVDDEVQSDDEAQSDEEVRSVKMVVHVVGKKDKGRAPPVARARDEPQSASEDEKEEGEEQPVTRDEFLTARAAVRNALERDGKELDICARNLRNQASMDAAEQRERQKALGADRRAEIETRILEFGDYTEADFTGAWYTSKVINAPEAVTDENWETVKPKVIKLLERIKKNEEKLEAVMNVKERQEALRPRYEKLLNIQPNKASRHALPLFFDFVHFDSVKPLWEPEDAKPEDDDIWAEHLEGILEELDDYSISVRVRAVQMILGATTDIDERELDGDADDFGPENFDDDWLKFPTSFLVCSFPNCRQRGNWNAEDTSTFFGSLQDLQEHQHSVHADHSFTEKQMAQRLKRGYVGDFHLPPLVVSALSAIIELSGKTDDEATVNDLNELMGGPRGTKGTDRFLFWENGLNKKYHNHWTDVIEEAVKQSARAEKNGRTLEVPIIEYTDLAKAAEERAQRHQEQLDKMLKKRRNKKVKTGRRQPWDSSDSD